MAVHAGILHAEGVEALDHYDSRERPDTVHSSVVSRGGDDAGLRAVELAWAHDYEPQGLVRDWIVVGKELGEGHWMILFD